jgi:prophage regulatory protein
MSTQAPAREVHTSPIMQRLLKLPAVLEICGISKSSLYRLEAEFKFPRRVVLCEGGRSVAWREDEILEWVASRPRAADKRAEGQS